MEKIITKELISEGIRNGIVRFIIDPNMESGTVCKIGEYWFYFGGTTAEEEDPSEFLLNADRDDVVNDIYETLADFPDEGMQDEYNYYLACLTEEKPVKKRLTYLTEAVSRKLQAALEWKEGDDPDSRFGEDDAYTISADFGDGMEMDVKVCGVAYEEGGSNSAYSEAVLFKNGSQVACSEPGEELLGSWGLEYYGTTYVSEIFAEDENVKRCRDCVCLVEGINGEWMCDDFIYGGREIHSVECRN